MELSKVMNLLLILIVVIVGAGIGIGIVSAADTDYHTSTKEAKITVSDPSEIIKSAYILYRHDGGQMVIQELNLAKTQHIINVPLPANIVDVLVQVTCKVEACVGSESPNDHAHNTVFVHQRKEGMEPIFDMDIVVERIGHYLYYPDTVVTVNGVENNIIDESKKTLRVEGTMPIVNTVHAFLPMEPITNG
jgi:hypothetical protein